MKYDEFIERAVIDYELLTDNLHKASIDPKQENLIGIEEEYKRLSHEINHFITIIGLLE